MIFLAAFATFLAPASNPFEPLSAAEITLARRVAVVRLGLPTSTRFMDLSLREPSKAELQGKALKRRANLLAYLPEKNATYTGTIDLDKRSVLGWKLLPGVQPLMTDSDYKFADEIVRADPKWRAAVARRGLRKIADLHLEPWAPGVIAEHPGRRLMKVLTFLRGTARNPYGRPVEGLIAIVDVQRKQIVEIQDDGGPAVAADPNDYDAPEKAPVVPPNKPAFGLDHHEVSYGNWRFGYSLQPREGLVLHQIRWVDAGVPRSIIHRLSLAEMSVPYADPSCAWSWRSAFDVGEYGIGLLGSSLEPGQDAPPGATLLDEYLPQENGLPRQLPRAVGIYERDGGVLWRHWDFIRNETVSRRAKELVICAMTSVGNYDYLVSYSFRTDGSIGVEVGLTGIMLTKGSALSEEPSSHKGTATGHIVAPNIEAVNHQHYINFRIDFDVDGSDNNSVLEEETRSIDSPDGNAFSMTARALPSELEACRDLEPLHSRRWRVINPNRRNATGWPSGYAIQPGETAEPYLTDASENYRRAGFIQHLLWVTKFHPEERFPAGDFPNLNATVAGLPEFIKDDESIESQDLVIWYTVGVHHLPRPEDWPIMPTHRAGFRLSPVGFFDRNPTVNQKTKKN